MDPELDFDALIAEFNRRAERSRIIVKVAPEIFDIQEASTMQVSYMMRHGETRTIILLLERMEPGGRSHMFIQVDPARPDEFIVYVPEKQQRNLDPRVFIITEKG